MPTLEEVIRHPGFAGLPEAEKIKALEMTGDARWKGLPTQEKYNFIKMPFAATPPPAIKNPNEMGLVSTPVRAAEGVKRTLIDPMVGMAQAVTTPGEGEVHPHQRIPNLLGGLFRGAQTASQEQFQKGFEQYDRGGINERGEGGLSPVGRMIAGAVPMVGPAVAGEVDRMAQGDVAGGAGGVAGMMIPLVLANRFRRGQQAAPQAAAPSAPASSPVTAPGPVAPPVAPVAPAAVAPQTAMQPQVAAAFDPSRRQFLKAGAGAAAAAVTPGVPKAVTKAVTAPALTDPKISSLTSAIETEFSTIKAATDAVRRWGAGDKTVTRSGALQSHRLIDDIVDVEGELSGHLDTLKTLQPDLYTKYKTMADSLYQAGTAVMDPNWIRKGTLTRRRLAAKNAAAEQPKPAAETPAPQAPASAQGSLPEQAAPPAPVAQTPPAATPEAIPPAKKPAGPPKRSERPESTPEEKAIADGANLRIAREKLAVEMQKPNPDPVVVDDLEGKIQYYGGKTRQTQRPAPAPTKPPAPASTIDEHSAARADLEAKIKKAEGMLKDPLIQKRIKEVVETAKGAGVPAKDLLERFVDAANVTRVVAKGAATGHVSPMNAYSGMQSMARLASKPWGANILKKWIKSTPGTGQYQFWVARMGEAIKKEEEREKKSRPSPSPTAPTPR